MRDALRQSSGSPFDLPRIAVQTARLSAAEFGGRADSDAEPNGSRGRRAGTIASSLADVDCAQFKPKTGNIKLE